MSTVGLPTTLYDEETLRRCVIDLAGRISLDYAGTRLEPVVVGVLKGSWVFMADLVRRLSIPVVCDFIRVRSYDTGTISSGKPTMLLDVSTDVTGRRVILVEDIVDTGLTARFMLDHLIARNPADIRLCALLDKPSRRLVPVSPDYVGFSIPDLFVVGYGLDVDERYRQLPYVAVLEPPS